MDELKSAWEKAQQEYVSIKDINLNQAIKANSHGVMMKLSRGIKYKMWFAVGGMVLFVLAFIFSSDPITRTLLAIVTVAYVVGAILINKESRLLKAQMDFSGNIKETLTSFYSRVNGVLKYEELIGITIYPVSASAGFLIGLGKSESRDWIFSTWQGWMIFIAILALATFLAHLTARKLNKIAFGKYLNELKSEINELDQNEN